MDLELRYPPALLEARKAAAQNGSFRERVRYDLIDRPPYAFGLLAAADMARFCGVSRITAMEFGVAEGAGLLNLCEVAAQVTAETGIAFDIIGFDTGKGLPQLEGYRDHPEIWSAGDFAGVDAAALEAKLPAHARIIWGDIRETLPDFIASLNGSSPIGFIANDLDLYSSTAASFQLLRARCDALLPVVIHYFDDTHGSPTRIGSLFRNRWCGQFAAIEDFNAAHEFRKIDRLYTLHARRPMDRELWLEQMFALHVLDHPQRGRERSRDTLKMHGHGHTDLMHWPL